MVEAQNKHTKIVSIDTFRATRSGDRSTGTVLRAPVNDRPLPSARNIAHRERMLHFLRLEALEGVKRKPGQEAQGRLLL